MVNFSKKNKGVDFGWLFYFVRLVCKSYE